MPITPTIVEIVSHGAIHRQLSLATIEVRKNSCTQGALACCFRPRARCLEARMTDPRLPSI